jgi:acyl-CoA synthetase (AMP-forming)/AMP-acid ligase II/3-hydroxymyristoyl/3-hydroxydecanoyl-(acyl carrier protein) dehydratase
MSDFFSRLTARAPQALAGRRAGAAVTHHALMARARAWSALARASCGRNVALFHDDSLEFAAALLGAWQAGKTVWLAADALPATCAALRGSVDAFWGQYPHDCAPQAPAAAERCGEAWPELAPDFPALVVHTSGSTGAPKAISKQMSQLTSELAALEAQFGAQLIGAEVLATVSHQHIYGLLFRVLWPLQAGRVIHADRYDHPEALALALAQRPCLLVASPAHLKRLPEHLDWQGAATRLRAVFSSGGMLPAEASLHARGLLGQAPVEVYGSSETGGIAWRQRAPDAGDSWRALPFVEWRVSESEHILEVRSDQVGPGGWLQLADRIAADGNGGFVLQGRSDRIVKIEEKRVSLEAVEAALTGSGLALEARVIACPEHAGGRQALAAFVVPTPAGQALLDADGRAALNKRLRAVLAGAVEAVALPRRWRYLEQMPVNAAGKTSHAQLLALLGEDADPRPRLPAVRVLESTPERVLLELTVPADLLYFDGHFTVAPVLPGVVQVDWAIFYGRSHFALHPAFRAISALKFQQMIRPGRPVQLELVHDRAKDTLNFRYISEAGAHASGRILFGTD